MFPESTIEKSYKQKSDKVKYMLQLGIAPYKRDHFERIKCTAIFFLFQ